MTRPAPSLVAFLLSCVLIVFGTGVVVGRYQIFPYPAFAFAKNSFDLVVQEALISLGIEPTGHAEPSRYQGEGVTINKQGSATPGLTLLSGFFDRANELRLIRLDGTLVHRWNLPFEQAFPDPDHVRPPVMIPKTAVNFDLHGMAALPDGSVVFNYNNLGTVKLDRCGAVLWKIPRMTHHALSPAEDGGWWEPVRNFVCGA